MIVFDDPYALVSPRAHISNWISSNVTGCEMQWNLIHPQKNSVCAIRHFIYFLAFLLFIEFLLLAIYVHVSAVKVQMTSSEWERIENAQKKINKYLGMSKDNIIVADWWKWQSRLNLLTFHYAEFEKSQKREMENLSFPRYLRKTGLYGQIYPTMRV